MLSGRRMQHVFGGRKTWSSSDNTRHSKSETLNIFNLEMLLLIIIGCIAIDGFYFVLGFHFGLSVNHQSKLLINETVINSLLGEREREMDCLYRERKKKDPLEKSLL